MPFRRRGEESWYGKYFKNIGIKKNLIIVNSKVNNL
jgi:hypothetical protein